MDLRFGDARVARGPSAVARPSVDGIVASRVPVVLQPGGDHVDHRLVVLDPPVHFHQPRAHHHLALPRERVGPDDEVGDPGLVLERDEHTPLALPGRWRISTTPAS